MQPRLVIFDVDGVLIPARSSWQYVHERLGTWREASRYARLYWEGRLTYLDWMYLDTMLWLEAEPGLTKEFLGELLEPIAEPLGEAYDAVHLLRRKGFEVALLSCGLDLVVERVARKLGVRLYVSPRLLFDERGLLIPGGEPLVEADAKHRWVPRFVETLGLRLDRVAVVGDTRLDAPPMRLAAIGVAVNPLDEIVVKAAEGRIAKDPIEAAEIIIDEFKDAERKTQAKS